MNNEITFGGLTTKPSDYDAPDGDLALSLNLINEDGSLRPIAAPCEVFPVGTGRKVFIHPVGPDSNYISYAPDGSTLEWIGTTSSGKFNASKPITIPEGVTLGNIVSIASVGLILVVSTEKSLFYIRFNAKTSAYAFLGGKPPEIKLDLALKLNFIATDTDDPSLEILYNDSESTASTPPEDDWKLLLSNTYDFSYEAGTVTPEDDYSSKEHFTVYTDLAQLDPAFKLSPGVEYMFRWEALKGVSSGGTISFFGNRNGSTEREMIFWAVNHSAEAGIVKITKTFDDEWTNISYQFSWISIEANFRREGTAGSISIYSGFDNSATGSDDVKLYIKYSQESHTSVMGLVNKFVNEQGTEKSRHIYPFYIRYAVRLYNGSYSSISEPVLMIPNSGYVPAVAVLKPLQNSSGVTIDSRIVVSAFVADIQYKLSNSIPEEWKDLITGIDIFISQPVWCYNQAQEFDHSKNYFKFSPSPDSYGFGCPYLGDFPCNNPSKYGKFSLSDYIARYASVYNTHSYVQIAPRPILDIRKDLLSTASFYKVASLDIPALEKSLNAFKDLELTTKTLSSLVTREALKSDSLEYAGYKNALVKEYNSRLLVHRSSVILRPPSPPDNCFNFISRSDIKRIVTYISIATSDGTKIVRNSHSGEALTPWFFYPDARAFKASFVLYQGGSVVGLAEIDLDRHDFLNGVYWLAEDICSTLRFEECSTDPFADATLDNSVSALPTIYVSETNNPFIFKAQSIVTVGAREVTAVSSAAKALSQGQFGQFPLYAFTDNGVWALEVSPTGTFTARQPITRDVCINPDAITQIDSAVLFPTRRGIMMIAGSETVCISEAIGSDSPFNVLDLPHMDALHRMLGHGADSCLPMKPLSEFLSGDGCGMLFDYPGQRIIVFSPEYTYAYVYSLKSRLWATVHSKIKYSVNSYPEALAVTSDGKLVNLSRPSEDPADGIIHGLLVTRPLKLGAPDILKTVGTVIQRGLFRRGHVKTALYASRDLFNWLPVRSSVDHFLRGFSGTPYKYFRLALVCELTPDESISGASLVFEPRMTNQLR